MTGSRHLGIASIITTVCVALRDGVLAARLNGFFNLEIEGDSKVIIDCYKTKSSLPSSIILLIEDIWGLTQDLNILNCCHIYREANRITDCLAKKGICNTNSVIWWSEFPKDVRNFAFEDYCGTSFNCICRMSYM